MISDEDLQDIHRLEERLDLPVDFCMDLIEENDWTFVIRTSALFESALSLLIVKQLGRDELLEIISELPMGTHKSGKIGFVNALGYIGKEELTFLLKWSSLRNDIVHNIANATFSLTAYFTMSEKRKVKEILKGFYIPGYFQDDINKPEHFEEALSDPKRFLFLGALSVIHGLSCYFEWAESEKEIERYDWLVEKFAAPSWLAKGEEQPPGPV